MDSFPEMPAVLALVQELESTSAHRKQVQNIGRSLLGTWTGSADTLDVNGHTIGSAIFENSGKRHPSTSIL